MTISKMSVKMNFRIITKNHTSDPVKGFLTKSIAKPYGPYVDSAGVKKFLVKPKLR